MAQFFHDMDAPRSRRRLFKWLGQVAAGAAVADLGLRALNPETARADGPDTPCVGCTIISCSTNHSGCSGVYVVYKQYYGQPPCKYNIISECASSCSCV